MRGRTNITGGGMNLNADVQEFTVASGKNVVSGDFVSYYTTVSEKALISSPFSTYDHTDIGNGLCIVLSNNILYLLKLTENGLEIVDAYNDYTTIDYALLSDGSIALCIEESPYLIRVSVSSERFGYVCSVSGEPSDIFAGLTAYYVSEHNGELYLFSSKNSDSYLRLSVYLFDVSNSSKITYKITIASDKYFENWKMSGNNGEYRHRIYKPIFVGDYLFAFSDTNYDDSLNKIFIDKNAPSIELVGAIKYSYAIPEKIFAFYDKYLLWKRQGVQPVYCLYNIKTDAITTYELKNFGFAVSGTYTTDINTSLVGDGGFCVLYTESNVRGQNGIFKIREATGDLSLASNIFVPTFSQHFDSSGVIYLDGTVNNVAYSSGRTYTYVYSYEPSAELLTEKVNKNYVQPYTGGLAIGVAKQSGKAGQSIEVYVAKPSA